MAYRQPQPGSAAARLTLRAVERLAEFFQVPGRNAGSGVGDAKRDPPAPRRDVNIDLTTLRRKFDRVRQRVAYQMLQLVVDVVQLRALVAG